MFHKISRDVKIVALNLHENGILPLPDILACVGFSESTFYHILQLWRETGDIVSHRQGNKAGCPCLLHFDDVQYLLCLVWHQPDWFLDELLNLLKQNHFVSVHYTTIHPELECTGMSHKKLKIIAKERNELLQNDYMWCMAKYSPEQLGFLDETSKNNKTPGQRYGRGRMGRQAQMKQAFVQGQRLSVEGLLTVEGIVASTVVEGSMKQDSFLQFLENQVVCCWLLLASSNDWTCCSFHSALHFLDPWVSLSPWQRNCRVKPIWYASLSGWKSLTYCYRCSSCISPSLFSRLQSHRGGIFKDQSMDPT